MRRNLCRFPYSARSPAFTSSSATAFCTSAGGGSGRGRGSILSNSIFTSNDDSIPGEPSPPPPPPSMGHGRGRGQPLASSPVIPPLSSFIINSATPGPDKGRGRGTGANTMPPPLGRSEPSRKPVVERSDDSPLSARIPSPPTVTPNVQVMPSAILSVLSGSGRGKPSKSQSDISAKPKEENRHIQPRQTPQDSESGPRRQRPVQDNSTRSLDDGGGGGGGRGGLEERYNRGRGFQGMRGRGRGRGQGRGRGRDSDERRNQFDDADNDDSGLYLGNDADGERLAQKLGPEKMNILAEAFEEVCGRVLPSPVEDAYVDALHTNLLLECEPEYLMEEFGTNPDIDEKPPIPFRDALEKMKPFLMAYEGIQSQEEWEAIIEDLMQRVPLLEEIVEYYSGPDTITAKQQHQELERVATTLPASTPASLKRFANNAVLSLQSNPGWGFDKKCQLMDTLVREVSQNYK